MNDNFLNWINNNQLGLSIKLQEMNFIESALSNIYGNLNLQIEYNGFNLEKYFTNLLIAGQSNKVDIYCDIEKLPFKDDCFSNVIIPHTLDFTNNFDLLLKEVKRILVTGGKLFIIGFNSMILYHLLIANINSKYSFLDYKNIISYKRLKQYLESIGFKILQVKFMGYLPILDNIGISKYFNKYSLVYGLLVIKEGYCVTPLFDLIDKKNTIVNPLLNPVRIIK